MSTSRRQIQPSGSIPSTGKLFDAGSFCTISVRDGAVVPGLGRPRGLFLTLSRQYGCAEIRIILGEGTGGAEAARTFHLDGRGLWLSVVGWDFAKIEVLSVQDGVQVSYAWLTEHPPSGAAVVPKWRQTVGAGSASSSIPFGAIFVTPSRNEAGAVWVTSDGTATYTMPASLVAGVRVEVSGAVLTYAAPLATPLTLEWSYALV